MHYLAIVTFVFILSGANLLQTVANEKPVYSFPYYPILDFGDIFDKPSDSADNDNTMSEDSQDKIQSVETYAWLIEIRDQPETHDEEINNKGTGKVITEWLMNKRKPSTENTPDFEANSYKLSHDDEDDDDEICHNETTYSSLDYIVNVLLKTDMLVKLLADDEEVDDKAVDAMYSKLLHFADKKSKIQNNDKKVKDDSDISSKTESEHDKQQEGKNVDDLSETEPELEYEESQYLSAENNNNDTSEEEEDIGKLLREADLFDYELFANVYVQEYLACSISTADTRKVMDLPTGLFEAIDIVYNDLMNKLN